jgi:hypothetical protein
MTVAPPEESTDRELLLELVGTMRELVGLLERFRPLLERVDPNKSLVAAWRRKGPKGAKPCTCHDDES